MKNSLSALVSIFAFSALVSCQSSAGTKNNGVELMPPEAFVESYQAESEALLIDCRTPREVSLGAIEGSINLDYRSPVFDVEVEKLDKDVPVYIYCQGGGRSAAAAEKLRELGFEEIHDMKGGYGSLSH